MDNGNSIDTVIYSIYGNRSEVIDRLRPHQNLKTSWRETKVKVAVAALYVHAVCPKTSNVVRQEVLQVASWIY